MPSTLTRKLSVRETTRTQTDTHTHTQTHSLTHTHNLQVPRTVLPVPLMQCNIKSAPYRAFSPCSTLDIFLLQHALSTQHYRRSTCYLSDKSGCLQTKRGTDPEEVPVPIVTSSQRKSHHNAPAQCASRAQRQQASA